MSFHDELANAQQSLNTLSNHVAQLEQRGGQTLEIRRVRSDIAHLRESLDLLRAAAGESPSKTAPELVTIPDAPYDSTLWTDAEDEGLGARDRRAP
ncbi:hypothetical protein [Streptomyces sp. NPDC005438]|uniref:hypothetical protein n=1 Tax=Streptomyces sp. NPDC005438 TaxID=3156880 RepID=UPI0033AEA5F4